MIVFNAELFAFEESCRTFSYDVAQLTHGFPPGTLILFHQLLLRLVGEILVNRAYRLKHVHVGNTIRVQLVPQLQQLAIGVLKSVYNH